MSILNKMSALSPIEAKEPKKITITGHVQVAMTEDQIKTTKAYIIANKLGYNVQPNQHDIGRPYRVAIKYSEAPWANFGQYESKDVAAAIGTIVSMAYFGEKAKVGSFDQATVEASKEYQAFLVDARNVEILARANGELPTVHAEAAQAPF